MLRMWCLVVGGLLLGVLPGYSQEASKQSAATFFDSTKVWKVHIELSASEFQAMQPRGGFMFGMPKAPALADKTDGPAREIHKNTFGVDLPWAKGTVTVDGQKFTEVGIRFKGNGTISDSMRQSKKSFKIDLDYFGGKDRFQNLKTINLNSGVADPSKCRETLGYAIYRAAGVPAPRTTFAEVEISVPGKYDRELYGIYTVIEQPDKAFLKHHFGTDQGLLMKPEGLREFVDLGDDWAKYAKVYEAKREPKPDEVKRVVALIRLITKADDATFNAEIRKFVHIDSYLRFLATTSFIANADSFFSLGHNFYCYLHPKTQQFHFFPWDVDRAFSNLPVLGSNTQQMNLSLVHPYSGNHKLTERILAIPEISEQYQRLLKELASTAFAKDRLLKLVNTHAAIVKEPIARDGLAAAKRKEFGVGFGPAAFLGKPPALPTFIDKRTASVEAQIAGKSKGHIPVNAGGPGNFKAGDFVAGPLLEALDDDSDGQLSRKEWLDIAKRLYTASDKSAQGAIVEKQLTEAINDMLAPKPPEGAPAGPAMPFGPGNFMAVPIFKRIGPNPEGKVTQPMMMSAAEKIFDEFDKTKSGKLDEAAFGELLNVLFPTPKFNPPKPKEPMKS